MSLPYAYAPNIGFGSVIVTMSSGTANGVSFIANELTATFPTAETSRTTELGAPNGFVLFKDPSTVSGQLQLASNTTNTPSPSDEFPVTFPNYGTYNYVMTQIGLPRRPRDIWVVDFNAREKI
jgi:hypothetical protein